MGYVVYILRSQKDGRLYVGQASDLDRRLAQHNNSNAKSYTAWRGPWDVVHVEPHPSRTQAMRRETFLKSVAGSREKKRLAGAFGSDDMIR